MAVFRHRIIFIAFTLLLSLFAMVASYAMVRWLSLGIGEERVPDPMVQRRAILLRGFANDLTKSCNDYIRVVPDPKGGVMPDVGNWIDRVYRRDLRFLEQRMTDNTMSALPAYLQLLAAVRRCASMARHPEDQMLRQSALRDARRAIEEVDFYIEGIGMARLAGPPPRHAQFE